MIREQEWRRGHRGPCVQGTGMEESAPGAVSLGARMEKRTGGHVIREQEQRRGHRGPSDQEQEKRTLGAM